MIIHDHFDGSAHCVECHGQCSLTGDERAVTEYVRWTMETIAMQGWKSLPSFWRDGIKKLGLNPDHVMQRAICTAARVSGALR